MVGGGDQHRGAQRLDAAQGAEAGARLGRQDLCAQAGRQGDHRRVGGGDRDMADARAAQGAQHPFQQRPASQRDQALVRNAGIVRDRIAPRARASQDERRRRGHARVFS
jgi:hypothetical protein